MTLLQGLTALLIHIIVPLVGIGFYIRLVRKMEHDQIEAPPKYELFIIFATYGGLLLVVLTAIFWMWSGMASLGFFYLLIGAPIVMGIMASSLNVKKEISTYHKMAYKAAIWYFAIGPITLLCIFLAVSYLENL